MKEGPKPDQTADCSATFTVKGYEPPTISCSASPSTINPGDSATVTSVGVSRSPANLQLHGFRGGITDSGTNGGVFFRRHGSAV